MSRYTGIKFVLVSPVELKVPSYIKKDIIVKNKIEYVQTTDLESVMPDLDILYMTRVQKERFFNEQDYIRLKDSYILTPQKLADAKSDLAILHPLPRVNEISVAVDDDPRACYFRQVLNGKFVRMALICRLLDWQNDSEHTMPVYQNTNIDTTLYRCPNQKCICNNENVEIRFHKAENGTIRCFYCETKARK
jgi:aspartate carbamoyltransferase catalytic subunit